MKNFALSLALLCLSSPLYSQVIYLNGKQNLFEFDVNTCEINQLPDVSASGNDISFHPNGSFYTLSHSGEISTLNPMTGESYSIHTFSGSITNSIWTSLVISNSGVAYATGSSGLLYSYDFSSGEQSYHGSIGYAASGDLIFYEEELYMAADGDKIIKINIANPENSEVIIDESVSGNIYGLVSYATQCTGKTIYAISGNEPSKIYKINFDAQSFELVCELDFEIMGGASTYDFYIPQNNSPLSIGSIEKTSDYCLEGVGSLYVLGKGGEGKIQYSFNDEPFGDNNFFNDLASGTYMVQIKDETDCIYSEEIYVPGTHPLTIKEVKVVTEKCNNRDGSIFIDTKGGTGELTFSYDEGISNAKLISGFKSGTYSLHAIDEVGCEDVTSFTVPKEACPIYIPNSFSPNGDENNDIFKVYTSEDYYSRINYFKVYDRWGDLVFESYRLATDNPKAWWDGTMNGQAVRTGLYVYNVEIEFETGEKKQFTGEVNLLR